MALQARKVLMVSSIFHFMTDAAIVIVPAVSPVLFKEFNFSYYDAGVLYGVILSVMIVFQVVFGILSDRFNELDLMAIGNALVASSCLLLALTSSRLELFAYNALFAIGASVFHPVSYAVLSRVNPDVVTRTRHMGFSGSAGDFGSFVAVALTGLLLELLGWRNLFQAWVFVILSASAAYALVLRFSIKHPSFCIEIAATRSESVKFTLGMLVPLIILCLAMGGIYRIHLNFIPLFLTDSLGLTPGLSGAFFSFFLLARCFGAFSSGLIVSQFGSRKALFLVFLALFVLSPMLWLHGYIWGVWVFASIIASGFVSYVAYPIIFGLFSQLFKTTSRGRSYGFIVSLILMGGASYSFISGKLADLTSDVSITFALSSITALAAALAVLLIKTFEEPNQVQATMD